MSATYDIAIVIVVYNPTADDMNFISKVSSSYRGVVVDNSPKVNLEENCIGNMQYIPLKENTGIAHAQNVAIKHILDSAERPKYIMFFDQDSRYAVSFPQIMAEEYGRIKEKVKNLAMLGPEVVNIETGKSYKSVIHTEEELDNGFVPKREIISSGSIVQTDILSKIGMMVDTMFIDFVDFEWCWRAKHNGFICGITKNVSLKHKVGKNTKNIFGYPLMIWAPYRYYYQYRNYIWLARVTYTPLQWIIATGIKFVLRMFYFPLSITNGTACVKQMIRGIKDAIKSYSIFKREMKVYE